MKSSSKYTAAEMEWLLANCALPIREYHRQFIATFGRRDTTRDNLRQLRMRHGWKTGRPCRFQKGNPSPTYRGPGAETVDRYGYVWIIVPQTNPRTGGDTRQVLKHKWLWEQENGPVPQGYRLKCLDGDKANTSPENWTAIPHGVIARINGISGRNYDSAPAELKPTIMAVAKLEHALRGRSS